MMIMSVVTFNPAMLIGDPSRPVSFQIALERFGLADAAKGVAKSLLDQASQSLENAAVLFRPPVNCSKASE